MRINQNTQQSVPLRYCDDCVIGKWYDVEWNRSMAEGRPLTKHCMYGGKGLLRGTPACDKWKQ